MTRRNLWGRGAAQVFASVSPAMHEEFDTEYLIRYFEGFGLLYYGCCEPLDRKLHIIKRLPNLRKISITPWADVRTAAEQMGGDYVLSRKPNPAHVASSPFDETVVRADIQDTLRICRETGTPCEFVLKDISTVGRHPDTLTRWTHIAMKAIESY